MFVVSVTYTKTLYMEEPSTYVKNMTVNASSTAEAEEKIYKHFEDKNSEYEVDYHVSRISFWTHLE